MHRKVASRDHKLVYWIAGGISALSVLLEKKARRGELALYVLPRSVDSLWYILVNRHLLPKIRNAEVCHFVTLHLIKRNSSLISFCKVIKKIHLRMLDYFFSSTTKISGISHCFLVKKIEL
jgi:hypothetical protein